MIVKKESLRKSLHNCKEVGEQDELNWYRETDLEDSTSKETQSGW